MLVPFGTNCIQVGETAIQEPSFGITSAVLLTWETTEIEVTRETRCLALLLVCEAIPFRHSKGTMTKALKGQMTQHDTAQKFIRQYFVQGWTTLSYWQRMEYIIIQI